MRPELSQQTATEQPIIQQPPIQEPKRGTKMIFIALGVLLLLLIGGGSYYLCVKNNALVKNTTLRKVIPTRTPTPDPTVGWLTYANQKYSYSVKYPSNLTPHEDNTYYHDVTFDLPKAADGSSQMYPYLISVIPDTFIAKDIAAYNFMSSDWINSLFLLREGYVKKAPGDTNISFTKLPNTKVAGQNALTVEVDITGESNKQRRVYVQENGYFYMISNVYQNDSELSSFQDMLNSFKFVADTSSWKTYTDTVGAFSFKYPSDWNETVSTNGATIEKILNPHTAPYADALGVIVSRYKNSYNLNAKQFLQQIFYNGDTSQIVQFWINKDDKVENIMLGGRSVEKIDDLAEGAGSPGWGIWIKNKGNGIFLEFPYSSDRMQSTIDQDLLSSFKFTQ